MIQKTEKTITWGGKSVRVSKVSDLPMCSVSATLFSRNGEKRRVHGKIIEKKTEKGSQKYLLVKQSPKKSYGPGTRVLWWRKKRNG